jgi:hypothetical protein
MKNSDAIARAWNRIIEKRIIYRRKAIKSVDNSLK